MQRMLNQILEGHFTCGEGELHFSCEEIVLTLEPEGDAEGSFVIYGSGDGLTYGYLASTDVRMVCLEESFSGAECRIGYRFSARGLLPGTTVEGEFQAISNRGEYLLPFRVMVENHKLLSPGGEITTLSDFTELAKQNWTEAVRLFYAPSFAGLVECWQEKVTIGERKAALTDLYRILGGVQGNQRNLEEFLVAAGQKKPQTYRLLEERLELEGLAGITEEHIVILRESWGYTALSVEVQGTFLCTEKDSVGAEDFVGNQCVLPVYIDNSQLHWGKNSGVVLLSDGNHRMEVAVTVHCGGLSAGSSARREKKRLSVQLAKSCQNYYWGNISKETWEQEAGGLAQRLAAKDERDVPIRLFQVYLMLEDERYHEADWLLEHCGRLLDQEGDVDPGVYGCYRYLSAKLDATAVVLRQTAEDLAELYHRNPDSWITALCLAEIAPEYQRRASDKWELFKEVFEDGCRSPLLLAEALRLLLDNPALLRRLDGLEVQTLFYGAERSLLSEELTGQMVYLARRVKTFSPVLLRTLILCYNRQEGAGLLREICAQLICGGQTGKKAFVWYERGVEQDLRLTKLYEYYMQSFDLESGGTLSRKALLYFSYQSNLDYEHTAFFYRYALEHEAELGRPAGGFREKIESFVRDQIRKEHMNRDLAWLYRHVLTPGMLDEQMALSLSRLLFACQIRTDAPEICRVVCVRAGVGRTASVAVTDGRACLPVYDPEDVLALEDGAGNRSVVSVPYVMEALWEPEEWIPLVMEYIYARTGRMTGGPAQNLPPEFAGFYWKHADRSCPGEVVSACGRRLLSSRETGKALRQEILLKLTEYYRSTGDRENLDLVLKEADPERLAPEARSRLWELLVSQGKMEMAGKWLSLYGPYDMNGRSLMRYLDRALAKGEADPEQERLLVGTAMCAFYRRHWDSIILKYLCGHFRGKLATFMELWKAASSLGTDRWELGENILAQMIFTDTEMDNQEEIFACYLTKGEGTWLEAVYLSWCSFRYYTLGSVFTELEIRQIAGKYRRGEALQRMDQLAFLKYFAASGKEAGEAYSDIVRELVKEFAEQGIFLEEFRSLKDCGDLLEDMRDKTIVTERVPGGGRVILYYRLSGSGDAPGEFLWKEMRPVCADFYTASFVLFFGDCLEYRVVRAHGQNEEAVCEGRVSREDTPVETAPCRYEMVNDILLAEAVEDYVTLEELLEAYDHREYLNQKLFLPR